MFSRKRIYSEGGYTLIEIIFVIITIALITGAIVPLIRTTQQVWTQTDYRNDVIQNGRSSMNRMAQRIRMAESVETASDSANPMGFLALRLDTTSLVSYTCIADTLSTDNILLEDGVPLTYRVKTFNITGYDRGGINSTTDTGIMNSFKLVLSMTNPDNPSKPFLLTSRVKRRPLGVPFTPYDYTVLGNNDVTLSGRSKIDGDVHSNNTLTASPLVNITGTKTSVANGDQTVPWLSIDMAAYEAAADQVINGNLVISNDKNNILYYVKGRVTIISFFRNIRLNKCSIIAENGIRIWTFRRITMTPKGNNPLMAVKNGDIRGSFGSNRSTCRGLIFSENGTIALQGIRLRGSIIGNNVSLTRGGFDWILKYDNLASKIPAYFTY